MIRILSVLLFVASAASAGVSTRPAPTAMSIDELRREVASLRRENDELRARLAELEKPANDGKIREGMTIREARALAKGAKESRQGSVYTWVWTEKQTAKTRSLRNPVTGQLPDTSRFSLQPIVTEVVVRRIVAEVKRGRIIRVTESNK